MISSYIDSTNLKSDNTSEDISKLCQEARLFKMAAVCVLPYRVKMAVELLKDSNVKVCTVIGFPLGGELTASKLFSTRQALMDGASEIDVVINISAVKDGNYKLIENELSLILKLKREYDFILKVIVETALLDEFELITLIRLISDLKCDYIKTSTGFSSRGVSIEDIKTINAHKSKALKVKASGAIRDIEFAQQLIDLGVHRIGTSNAVKIIEES